MRDLPNNNKKAQEFIQGAATEQTNQQDYAQDLHKYVQNATWPILEKSPSPSMASGSTLNKPVNVSLKEYEWNSLDRHTKALGISKNQWIKYAILKLMEEEQTHFFHNK